MNNISFDFNNKLFVVTGATSGIGKYITNKICKYNGRVIAIGRNNTSLQELAALHRDCIYPICCDVRDDQSLCNFLKDAISCCGRVDGLVHCAGVSYDTPLRIFNENKAREIMDVSFWASVRLIQLLNKKMNHNPGCSYVIYSSVSAYTGGKALFAYAAAKSAVQSVARSFCKEIYSDGSRINTISPGIVKTKMTETVNNDFGLSDRIINNHLLGLGSVDDVSEMALFLLSDNASWITGQDFVIDGGYLYGGFE